MFKNYLNEMIVSMESTECSVGSKQISFDEAVDIWVEKTKEIKDKDKTLFFIGNGASAAMSAHMSADANKNGKLKSLCFNESSILTAISNDISYDEIFAFNIDKFAQKGDVLVTISSSGNSPNVIRAIEVAKEKGVYVITLSGLKESNNSRKMGDLNVYVPAKTYGIVEVLHQAILHFWLDMYLDKYEGGRI